MGRRIEIEEDAKTHMNVYMDVLLAVCNKVRRIGLTITTQPVKNPELKI